MDNLTSKTIFITGGAQGIGEATARLCAERGATVILADMKAEQGEAVAKSIGGNASFIQLDVREDAQVNAAFMQVKEKHGKLDALVCAAGILKGAFQTPEEMPVELFQMVQDVNVRGVFLCSKYATPMLEATGGVMVVIASGAGVISPSSSLAYGASKGGANGLGMTLGAHLAPRGIRVNVLCPGNIVTEMKLSVDIARAEMDGANVQDAIDRANQNYGVPEGMAKIIAFMVSDDADYLRGTLFTR
ncbi:MAG: SDR family oxidoreductase [Burkholderiales bacterium]|nr:SDR family oxidoreductase [Anaerolineae bacterium]